MWSVGRYDLRLSEEEFWSLTLREFCLLLDRWKLEWRYRETMAAITPWILATIHSDPKKSKRRWLLQDFTVTGLFKPVAKAIDGGGPEKSRALWEKTSAVMRAMGGK